MSNKTETVVIVVAVLLVVIPFILFIEAYFPVITWGVR